jgi:enoyl-CoA hydratase/carnithine racemase
MYVLFFLWLGLVSKVFPPDKLVEKAVELAEQIGAHSQIVVQMAKEAVNTCKLINISNFICSTKLT